MTRSHDIPASAGDPPRDGFAQAAHYVAASLDASSPNSAGAAPVAPATFQPQHFTAANAARMACRDERKERALAMARRGMHPRDIAATLGVSRPAIYAYAKECGHEWPVKPAAPKTTPGFKSNRDRQKEAWSRKIQIEKAAAQARRAGPPDERQIQAAIAEFIAVRGVTRCPPAAYANNDAWCGAGNNAPVRAGGDGQVRRR